jgi:prepilin-type N-terminal cleavage/methylation domain-containing protein
MKKQAFTLIELLVVIAIIAILAAILFPVFAQAKVAAKKTQSLSNAKNQTMAVIMYTGDVDDSNPFSEYGKYENDNAAGPQIQWYTAVNPYMKSGKQSNAPGVNGVVYGGDAIWQDPMYARPTQNQHYGINSDIAPGNYNRLPTDPGLKKAINNSIIESPAEKVLIMNKSVNGCDWSYPYLAAEEWYWTPFTAPINKIPTRDGSEIASGQLPRDNNTFLNRDASNFACQFPSATRDEELGQTPRFRYNGTSVAAWADGHASIVKRGQLQWYKNIAIPASPNEPWVNSWYPY